MIVSRGSGRWAAQEQPFPSAGAHLGMDTGVPPAPRPGCTPRCSHRPGCTFVHAQRSLRRGCCTSHRQGLRARPGSSAVHMCAAARTGSQPPPGSCLQGAPHPDVPRPFQAGMELTKSLSV